MPHLDLAAGQMHFMLEQVACVELHVRVKHVHVQFMYLEPTGAMHPYGAKFKVVFGVVIEPCALAQFTKH